MGGFAALTMMKLRDKQLSRLRSFRILPSTSRSLAVNLATRSPWQHRQTSALQSPLTTRMQTQNGKLYPSICCNGGVLKAPGTTFFASMGSSQRSRRVLRR